MKKIFTILLFFTLSLVAYAESPLEQKKFNPEEFQREQESFITREAHLTQQEAAAFFPLFREMQQKQRELFKKQKQLVRTNPQDEKAAEKLINDMDNIDMQIKKLQIQYHSKFMKVLPATRVYKCIKAEEHFKQMVMERMSQHRRDRK